MRKKLKFQYDTHKFIFSSLDLVSVIGKTIAGHYHIIRELGKGGFGQTYLAEDLFLPNKQHCVVKQFAPPRNIPSDALEQAKRAFEREAMVLHQLGQEHSRIPRLLAYPEEQGQFFLIQEYIKGKDLSEEIASGKKSTETKVINILEEILEILTFVHQKGVIHRDIKPSNLIRREKDGKLFLIDFGTVKQQVSTTIVTTQGKDGSQFAFQSIGYTPTEQLQLRPKFASDLYALGMTAIFALTGIHPARIPEDSTTREIRWREFAKASPKLADFIDKMVHHDYRDRYSTAGEALKALREIKLPATHIIKPQAKLAILKKIVATTALLLALGGGGYYIWRQNRTPLLLTYENSEYGIDLDYPDNWILEKIEDPFTLARFYPQKSQGKDVRVTLEAVKVEANSSLDEYTNIAISQILKYLPSAKIIDSQQIKLDGKLAHRVIYTGKDKDTSSTNKYLQVWYKEADTVPVLTYVAPEEKYQDFVETVEHTIINSLFVGELGNQ